MPVHQPRVARALALVDARNFRAANQHLDAGGAALERGPGAVHGGSACADHANALAREQRIIHFVGGVRPEFSRDVAGNRRDVRAADAVAAAGDHHTPRIGRALAIRGTNPQSHEPIAARLDAKHLMIVAHVRREHLTVPAQVIHPLHAGDLVQRLPGLKAELRLEPRAKGQRRHSERGAGELFGRAQGIHAGGRHPRALDASGCAVEQDRRDPEKAQRNRGRHARHSGTDDGDLQHRLPFMLAWNDPRLGGQIQPGKILAHPVFKRGQTGGAGNGFWPGFWLEFGHGVGFSETIRR